MDNFAGTQVHEDLEFQLALGNVDPYTLNQRRDLFDPSESAPDSIWSTEYLKEIFPTVPSASVLDYSPEEHIECMTCKCNDLDQEFETPPSSFRLHIKSRHGFGKCICETCGRFCNKPSQLVAHIRTHTLEKPFLCETCRVVSHKMRSRPSQEDSPAWHQGLCLWCLCQKLRNQRRPKPPQEDSAWRGQGLYVCGKTLRPSNHPC